MLLPGTPRRLLSLLILLSTATSLVAQDPFIPRRQSRPPGPPLSPQQAMEKMTVPEGFHVELVASEPDLLNPVAMAFDDSGRIFVTESFEYPRHEPGPGRDRIKILEDTDNDGKVDSVKIFADGLNIPSGIAVGYGGVWVANAPDILFLEDTDGDDRADRQTVIATGFGRYDTHELPNALCWGPDGYLYGLNGVFNQSVVKQGDKEYAFTCAMFRINPVTHQFDLFCEGTSNPWGISFDEQGSAFISACVIDHLWHLSETGYYHRQAGAYPPHTWKIDSIVDYKHQMAAYCGIEYFDSPAYPEQYRHKLYMGNIHGGCINVDSVTRHGSTYRGTPHDDFLTANDVWFMPVAQKTGPDGCLYILDWYDRYHCYQDASADPQGVDRGHGRLYRIVHDQRPAVRYGDLQQLADAQLLDCLADENIFYRQRAAVVLAARLRGAERATHQAAIDTLSEKFLTTWSSQTAIEELPRFPLYELTTLLYAPGVSAQTLSRLLAHEHPLVVAWTVRAIATAGKPNSGHVQQIGRLAAHPDPRVRLQVAIAAPKIANAQATAWLLRVLENSSDDGHLPRIVWRNLEPRIEAQQATIIATISNAAKENGLLAEITPRITERLLASVRPDLSGSADRAVITNVLTLADAFAAHQPPIAANVLERLVAKIRNGELRPAAIQPVLAANELLGDEASPLNTQGAALELRIFAADSSAITKAAELALDTEQPTPRRLQLLSSLARVSPATIAAALEQWAQAAQAKQKIDSGYRDGLFDLATRHAPAESLQPLLDLLPTQPISLQASVANQMCQRESTAESLLAAIESNHLPRDLVSPNQVRSLATSGWSNVQKSVAKIWGTVRQHDAADRTKVVQEMTRFLLRDARGDAEQGIVVWNKVCGQCHRLHDTGFEVGPELTNNGRGNFEQLIVSVFDPSLVIGNAYQSLSVLTTDGRVINGIVTERSDARLVLKVQGGKTEVLPWDDIEEVQENPNSLMPTGLEQQLTKQEIADLFALLSRKNPPVGLAGQKPQDQTDELIPGTPEGLHKK